MNKINLAKILTIVLAAIAVAAIALIWISCLPALTEHPLRVTFYIFAGTALMGLAWLLGFQSAKSGKAKPKKRRVKPQKAKRVEEEEDNKDDDDDDE